LSYRGMLIEVKSVTAPRGRSSLARRGCVRAIPAVTLATAVQGASVGIAASMVEVAGLPPPRSPREPRPKLTAPRVPGHATCTRAGRASSAAGSPAPSRAAAFSAASAAGRSTGRGPARRERRRRGRRR